MARCSVVETAETRAAQDEERSVVAPRANRRDVIRLAAGSIVAALSAPAIAQSAPKMVVIGGGFGGANCARALKTIDPRFSVTLVAESETYTAFPLSNAVLGGLRPLTAQQFGYQKIAAAGVNMAYQPASAIDPKGRTVSLRGGGMLAY